LPHLRYLASARLDIAQIQAYVTRESRSLAIGRGFARQLRLKCTQLASLPGQMGRARDEISEGLRSSAYKGHIIFFRYVGDEFQIVNILEGHRDAARHFGLDTEPDSED
jgi:plasmid stabilization system protein ParE